MGQLFLSNARIYQNKQFAKGSLLCHDGKIVAAGNVQNEGAPEFDCGGLRLAPGLIDVHTHGAAGVDVNAATPEQLREVSRFFAAQGVTGWLASVLTDTPEQTLWCLENIRQVMEQGSRGAALLGAHLEGPFLAPDYKGAMPEQLLKRGDSGLLRSYLQAAPDVVKYLTVSPEVQGVPELVAAFSDEIVVAIGHSGADYDTAMQVIQSGARCATHTFNAMKLFHQHFPAMMGAVLESDIWCEAICDGRHLHPAAVRLLLKAKGLDRVIAVTDSIMAAGLADGRYKLGVNEIVVTGGDARLAHGDSRAGSTLTAIGALRNLLDFTGRPLEEILPLMTSNVADVLRLSGRKGRIAPGNDADFVLLGENLEVAATIVGGEIVFTEHRL